MRQRDIDGDPRNRPVDRGYRVRQVIPRRPDGLLTGSSGHRPAAASSASIRSVRSQEKSGSSRPKCP